jgi:hypothetical protein
VLELVGKADLALADIDASVTAGELRWAIRTAANAEWVEQLAETWSTKWRLWPAPILAEPLDQSGDEQFVYFLRSGVMKFWPAAAASAAAPRDLARRKPGPDTRDEWLAFAGEFLRYIAAGKVPVPRTDARLVEHMLQWCEDKWPDGKAESAVKDAVRRLLGPWREHGS